MSVICNTNENLAEIVSVSHFRLITSILCNTTLKQVQGDAPYIRLQTISTLKLFLPISKVKYKSFYVFCHIFRFAEIETSKY
jgi:hypothetical protein